MATYLNMWKYEGYPTATSMRVWVEFEVTYAATYYTYFELYDENDNLIKSDMQKCRTPYYIFIQKLIYQSKLSKASSISLLACSNASSYSFSARSTSSAAFL